MEFQAAIRLLSGPYQAGDDDAFFETVERYLPVDRLSNVLETVLKNPIRSSI